VDVHTDFRGNWFVPFPILFLRRLLEPRNIFLECAGEVSLPIRHKGTDMLALQWSPAVPNLKSSLLGLASISATRSVALPFSSKDERKLLDQVLQALGVRISTAPNV